MQRRHQPDMRRAVEAGERELRKALVEIADRNPVDLAVATIYLADQGGKLRLELTVGADVATRRHRHL